MYWHAERSYGPLNPIKGFAGVRRANDYDGPIQFWMEFWKLQGVKFPEGLNALLIKALIAHESSFDPNKSSRIKAAGLMQLTRTALRSLSGAKAPGGSVEVRRHQVLIRGREVFDPVVNIAAGLRWISQKHLEIPTKYPKNLENTLRNYNDWPNGESYAKTVLELYEESR